MASPTFALKDILISWRQTNCQVIVSGVPSRRDNKYKGHLIAGYKIHFKGLLKRLFSHHFSFCQHNTPCLTDIFSVVYSMSKGTFYLILYYYKHLATMGQLIINSIPENVCYVQLY